MADKKEAAGKKDEETKTDGKGGKSEGEKDTEKSASVRSKSKIIAGIAGILVIALSVGGFFAYKTFAAKPSAQAALQESSHGAPADAHGEKPKEADKGHDEKKPADAHKDDKKPADAHAAETPKSNDKAPKSLGSIYTIPKMELNVGGPDLNRGYVRLALAIEFFGEAEAQKELEARTPQYRDIIINKVASTPKNDLLTGKGREELRKSIFNAINTVNTQPIKSLYFTEFLVE